MVLEYKAENFIENNSYYSFFCAESRKCRLHSHDFWELIYVYDGAGLHYTGDGTVPIKSGEFVLISPGAVHSIVSEEHSSNEWVRICNCLFTDAYFQECLKDYFKISSLKDTMLYKLLKNHDSFCLQRSDNERRTVRGFIYAINNEYSYKEEQIDNIVRNCLINFLVEATRIVDKKNSPAKRFDDAYIITNLKKYIASHLCEKLSLDVLAEQVHLSPVYVSKYFKKYTKENISDYILKLRMEKAGELLITTSYSITDICSLCGYSSMCNFQKYFKKYFGISPSAYRDNHSVQ